METKNPMFSILVVSLNPGEKIKETIDSILIQTETDYEIIIKDALSIDQSLELIPQDEKIRIIRKRDRGIYDGMNQAVMEARGEYVYFLNCGDYFYDENVLKNVKEIIVNDPNRKIYYGNTFFRLANTVMHVPKRIDEFTCFRNIPCHQACIFSKDLFIKKGFDLSYIIRADYEFFLRSYFTNKIRPKYMDLVIADYEGGGFSEFRVNMRRDKSEHKKIVRKYMKKYKVLLYQLIMIMTLQRLRKHLAQNSRFSGTYDKIKSNLYK